MRRGPAHGGTRTGAPTDAAARRPTSLRAMLSLSGCAVFCVLLLCVVLLVHELDKSGQEKPPSIKPRPTTRPLQLTAAPAPSPAVRTADPRACIWAPWGGEVYAAVSHSPPFWLALPAADPRFSEAVRAAVSAEEELVEFTASEDGGLPASLLAAYPPGSIMIDIGADIGLFALQLAALTCSEVNATTLAGTRCNATEGRFTVVAFEPRPDRALLLRHSAARNCFTNLIVSDVALASRNGTADLRWPASDPYAASIHPRLAPHMRDPQTAHVTTNSLDEFLRSELLPLEHVRFIQLSVPSSALQILRGAFYTLRRPPSVYLLLTIDAALMRNLHENPFELLALVTAAGLTPHFERRAWAPEEWPELVKLLEARGECVLHCVKYKGEAFEPRAWERV